jgi:hypothetical protein
MKKIISIVLAVLMTVSVFTVLPISADAFYHRTEKRNNDNFTYLYDKEDNDIEIYQYNGEDPEVVVPDEIDGYPVTKICRLAFEGCDYVTKISLPDTIAIVGEEAFSDTAFYKDENNWENGVLYIGSLLVEADESLEGDYTVKKGTSVIAHYAFTGCEKLTKITIPGTVKHIPESMFVGCKLLESAVLEDGVEDIDESVFCNCEKLENIKLPKSITRVGYEAFKNTIFYNNDYNWENGALYYNNILITVDPECTGVFTVKDGTTVLGDYTFSGCNIERIILPNGIKTLPFAFTNNSLWIESVRFGDDLEEAGTYSLDGLQNVELPDSLKKIDYRAFFQSTISEIKLPENLKVIDYEAFLSCSNLKEITIPKGVEKIGYEALGYRMSGINEEGYLTEKEEGLVIKGYPGTVAEAYAKENGFEFVDLTKESVTEPETTAPSAEPENKPSNITAKKDNPLKVTAKTKTLKAKKLKSKKQTVKALTVKKAQGKVSFAKVKKGTTAKIYKKITVNKKTGKITFKKGKYAKKTYNIKIKITATGNKAYKAKTVTKTVKIKVK